MQGKVNSVRILRQASSVAKAMEEACRRIRILSEMIIMKNKFIFAIIASLGLNISTIWASENAPKKARSRQHHSRHIVKIEIEINMENQRRSVEAYAERLKTLEKIARSFECNKKVGVDQGGYTIYMTIQQERLDKKQARLQANNLVGAINQAMPISRIEIINITRKKPFMKAVKSIE